MQVRDLTRAKVRLREDKVINNIHSESWGVAGLGKLLGCNAKLQSLKHNGGLCSIYANIDAPLNVEHLPVPLDL